MKADDGNFIVLHDDILLIAQSADENVLVSREEGVSTFANASQSLRQLQAGDKFCFVYSDGQYVTVKAAAIAVGSDGTVTITEDEEVYISDFYRLIKIETPFGCLNLTVQAGAKLELYYDSVLLGEDYLELTCLARMKAELEVEVDPNKKYRVEVLTYDENSEEIARATIGQNQVEKSFLILEDAVKVILRGGDNTLTGIVTDKETGEPISSATVLAHQGANSRLPISRMPRAGIRSGCPTGITVSLFRRMDIRRKN